MKNNMTYMPETWKDRRQWSSYHQPPVEIVIPPRPRQPRHSFNDSAEENSEGDRAANRGFGGFWAGATLGSWFGPLGIVLGGVSGAIVGVVSGKRREHNDKIESLLTQIASNSKR